MRVYAEKWQAEKELSERYEKVMGFIQEEAGNPDNCTDDRFCTRLWNIVNFCKEAIPVKTTNNEH